MKKIVIVALILCLGVACGGGSSVDSAIRQVEKALERVEKNKDTMTKADWEALDKEMTGPLEVINAALESDEIGIVGKVKVVMLVTKITAVMAEQGAKYIEQETGIDREQWGEELEKAGAELESAAEGIEQQ
jgi:Cu/Ag efflux pump CusA